MVDDEFERAGLTRDSDILHRYAGTMPGESLLSSGEGRNTSTTSELNRISSGILIIERDGAPKIHRTSLNNNGVE